MLQFKASSMPVDQRDFCSGHGRKRLVPAIEAKGLIHPHLATPGSGNHPGVHHQQSFPLLQVRVVHLFTSRQKKQKSYQINQGSPFHVRI